MAALLWRGSCIWMDTPTCPYHHAPPCNPHHTTPRLPPTPACHPTHHHTCHLYYHAAPSAAFAGETAVLHPTSSSALTPGYYLQLPTTTPPIRAPLPQPGAVAGRPTHHLTYSSWPSHHLNTTKYTHRAVSTTGWLPHFLRTLLADACD